MKFPSRRLPKSSEFFFAALSILLLLLLFQGDFGKFTYKLSSDPTGIFALDPATGTLTVRNPEPLDREKVERIELEVGVVEKVPSGLTPGVAKVTIYVGDENDNGPVFQPSRDLDLYFHHFLTSSGLATRHLNLQ
jgi:hypothetical protein